MTKKADKQDKQQHFGSHSELTEILPDHPQDIIKKRRLAYLKAVCMIDFLEKQNKLDCEALLDPP